MKVSVKLFSLIGTLIFAWLIWILSDTAVHHALTRSRKGLANARAQTMMPLIRNVLFVAIFIIALIVALANMGMNVTPLLAGAGVIGLAIGFGAQSLVADLITGLFIIIEDSLAIDDYVDVGGAPGHRRGPDHSHRAPAGHRRHRPHHSVQAKSRASRTTPGNLATRYSGSRCLPAWTSTMRSS